MGKWSPEKLRFTVDKIMFSLALSKKNKQTKQNKQTNKTKQDKI